jgi:hypothetical protein
VITALLSFKLSGKRLEILKEPSQTLPVVGAVGSTESRLSATTVCRVSGEPAR